MGNGKNTALSILCFTAIILSLSRKYIRTKYSVCNSRYYFITHLFLHALMPYGPYYLISSQLTENDFKAAVIGKETSKVKGFG